ncbi:hypothetical protein PhCBS80983_g01010 [Powellomyces hirtus]|uniref:ER membrane protein complex subunit 2 n=1 Tax=Powellomyces hirtus TaxID=109895 RepID=A0A507EER3_9FUNG|nr:hypothetical protein PhCBS80983_g01010 [Powellomyces hirtus]
MAPPNYNAAEARQKLASLRMGLSEPGITASQGFNAYDPTEVVTLGLELLKTSETEIEWFAVLEQVFVACLDKGDIRGASALLTKIESRFSYDSSVRVKRLHGLLAESHGDFDRAIEIYNAALEQDEVNVLIHKRLVAVLVSQGKRTEAIERLVVYVDAFMQDVEGWTELAALYLEENMLQQAAFCFEELLMLRPQNHLYHVRYAELLYTLGKFDPAVKYYCAALELCRDNVRALCGLRVATAAVLAGQGKEKGAATGGKNAKKVVSVTREGDEVDVVDSETITALSKLANDRLSALYTEAAPEYPMINTVVKSWLST